ncbi:MAG: J domain-containing protein, partial [Cyanobacteria bacterium P01_A01_bin.135]
MIDASSTTGHYGLLKVSPWASPQEIRRAYRELSKLYHPDTTTLPSDVAVVKFQQLNEAYGTLSNPERRLRYDIKHGYSKFAVLQPLEA